MKKTLRFKKTIGILAIILGGLGFLGACGSLILIDALEEFMNENYSLFEQNSIQDIDESMYIIQMHAPFILLFALGILIMGIILLSMDYKSADTAPRKKSRITCIFILCFLAIYSALELSLAINFASKTGDSISPLSIVINFGFLGVVIMFCFFGLFMSVNAHPQEIVSAKPKSLDEEIALLKKEIENLKKESN